jgi:hypothetical protein
MLACDVGRLLNMASIPLALALAQLSIAVLCITSLLEGTLAIFFDLARIASLN